MAKQSRMGLIFLFQEGIFLASFLIFESHNSIRLCFALQASKLTLLPGEPSKLTNFGMLPRDYVLPKTERWSVPTVAKTRWDGPPQAVDCGKCVPDEAFLD